MARLRSFTVVIALLLPLGLVFTPTAGAAGDLSRVGSTTGSTPTDSLILRAKALVGEGISGSPDALKQARSLALKATDRPAHRAWAHYWAALASYRLEGQYEEAQRAKRRAAIEKAIKHLDKATELAPEMSDAWALLARCYGLKTAVSSPQEASSLNRHSEDALAKAKQLAPKNPRVWIVSGAKDYHTPTRYGGSRERALKKFKKAARLARQESGDNPLAPSWGSAEAHAWIGLAHLEAGRQKKARSSLEQALAIKPGYARVKSDLLPRIGGG